MPEFDAIDGTVLAYAETGAGRPVVALPGGPMQSAVYLGDLGGLDAAVRLIRFDCRGTGASATPTDPQTYRCDRLVDDVETLREHLGLEQLTLLGHSAGANLALLYAARFPERVEQLLLITPSARAVGLDPTADQRREMVRQRVGEPWYADGAAAFERIQTGAAGDADWDALTPFAYGHWDDIARRHDADSAAARNDEAAGIFGSEGAFDPPATRAALARLTAPALVLSGSVDVAGPPSTHAELAALLPGATVVVQPAAGHFPWLDDPVVFVRSVTAFLS